MITIDELCRAYLEVFPEPMDGEWELSGDTHVRIPVGPLLIVLHLRRLASVIRNPKGDFRILLQVPDPGNSVGITLWEKEGSSYKEAMICLVALHKYLLGLSAAVTIACGVDDAPDAPASSGRSIDEIINGLLRGTANAPRSPRMGKRLPPDVVDEIVGNDGRW